MKIPFTVSARTARLIGRENIATANGALIELVKNAYDADAKICIVYFDNRLANLFKEISNEDFSKILERVSDPDLFHNSYTFDASESLYYLATADKDALASIREQLMRLARLWIIDDGTGMDSSVIKNHWMVIGTDIKNINAFTDSGRVKSGAKGIGRFALDKLGHTCKMITKPKDGGGRGHVWEVAWEHFEGHGKIIDNVTADLHSVKGIIPSKCLNLPTDAPATIKKMIHQENFKSGTILEIGGLSVIWDEKAVTGLFSNFETLIPPREREEFNIFLFASEMPKAFGEVRASVCDDFDYKISAEFTDDQEGKITVFRNEIDLEKLDQDVFSRSKMKGYPFNEKTFKRGKFVKECTLQELLPGINESGLFNNLRQIGAFSCTFYFLKRDASRPDSEKFFYRRFDKNARRKWLNEFGGIKIYRDEFRVRPYGELAGDTFDWLQLGQRKFESPAAASRFSAWRVAPQNIVGSINISRISNKSLDDKSSREGIQETEAFSLFKNIIISIINIFEDDRSYIASELVSLFSEKNKREENRKKAEEAAEKARAKGKGKSKKSDKSDEEVLADETSYLKEEIEELQEEQKLLRSLASIGTVISSLTHELHGLRNTMGDRVDELEELFEADLPREYFSDREDYLNPYILLDDMRKADEKIYRWLQYSLDAVKKDKRQRRTFHVKTYFETFSRTWSSVLEGRKATLSISFSNQYDPKIRAFEIDLDSIFNNLLVNSLDAFQRPSAGSIREIKIDIKPSRQSILIRYQDSGPGLSEDISDPNKIFECFVTTKRDEKTGATIGTGIGMWMVKSIMDEYNNGSITVLRPQKGFAVEIELPEKKT